MIPTVLLILCQGALLGQSPALLDLAASPAKPWKRPTLSVTVGGASFHSPQPEPKLPLQIEIESVEPLLGGPPQSLVNILVRNMGSEPYALPVGLDPDVALRATNRGRREFWFDLKVADERYSYLPGQNTYGSTDVPDTMMTIPPKSVVRVRFKIDVADALRQTSDHWRSEPSAEVNVQAIVVDKIFDDNPREYIQHLPQASAVSDNELRVPVVMEAEPTKPPGG